MPDDNGACSTESAAHLLLMGESEVQSRSTVITEMVEREFFSQKPDRSGGAGRTCILLAAFLWIQAAEALNQAWSTR